MTCFTLDKTINGGLPCLVRDSEWKLTWELSIVLEEDSCNNLLNNSTRRLRDTNTGGNIAAIAAWVIRARRVGAGLQVLVFSKAQQPLFKWEQNIPTQILLPRSLAVSFSICPSSYLDCFDNRPEKDVPLKWHWKRLLGVLPSFDPKAFRLVTPH